MPYALRFDGVNDVVSIPNGMTGNAGTGTHSFRIKSGPNGITLPATGLTAFIGTSQNTASNGLIVNSTGQLRVYTAGSNRYGSTSQLIFNGVPFDYTLTHLASGAWDIFNNLTSSATGESGTFATNTIWFAGTNALNQFGRSSSNNANFLSGDIVSIEVTGLTNAQDWEADLSGGAGTTLPTVSGTNQGTLTNFTVPACWILYSSGGTSWEGTIGKTSLTLVNDQLFVALGYDVTSGKQSLSLSSKQQSVSTGFNSTTNKTSLTIGSKQENVVAGHVLTMNKQSLSLSNKPLSVIAGSSVSFTGLLNKLSLTPSFKQLGLSAGSNLSLNKGVLSQAPKLLSISAGFNTTSNKQSLVVGNKQESISVGQVLTFEEQNLVVGSKQLNVSVGTTVSFVGELQKTGLNAVGKPLSVSAGTSVSFDGLINKTSLSLSGKVLDTIRGQVLDLQKRSISLLGKQLALGEAVYPIIPIERIFTLEDKGRVYVMKQETTIYLMSNRSSVHIMKGK